MKTQTIRGLLLAIAMLTMLAVAATTAHARVAPLGRTSVTSTRSNFSLDPGLPALTTTCPTAEFTGTVAADGVTIPGRITFSGNPRTGVTCTITPPGDSALVSCTGTFTLRSVASVAGTSASFDASLVVAPGERHVCSVTNLVTGATVNVDAQVIRGCITYTQAGNTLTFNRCTVRVTIGSGIASGTATFTGTFTPNPAWRIS